MSTRLRRGVAAALTVSALCFTAAACGGSSDDKKPAAGQEQSKDKAKGGDKESPALTPLTAAQMKAATVEVKDLPSGWKAGKVPVDNTPAPKADKPACQPLADLMGAKVKGATKGGDVDFKQADGKTELSQQVLTFAGAGAADFTKAVGTALDSCSTVSFEMEGEKTSVKIEKLDVPTVGEASHAFQMSIEFAPGIVIKADLLVAHQGTGATRVAYMNEGGATAQKDFADLVKRIGDKFVKGVQG